MSWFKKAFFGVALPAFAAGAGLFVSALANETPDIDTQNNAGLSSGEFLQFGRERVKPSSGGEVNVPATASYLLIDIPGTENRKLDVSALFDFCAANRIECKPAHDGSNVITIQVMSEAKEAQLQSVNDIVNQTPAENDIDNYGVDDVWAVGAGKMDCEDFSLEKRRQLIAQGWDPSSMYMLFVDVPDYGAHAVLVVRTDKGDQVLDNLRSEIMPVEKTGYVPIAATSRINPWEVYPVVNPQMGQQAEELMNKLIVSEVRRNAPLVDTISAEPPVPRPRPDPFKL